MAETPGAPIDPALVSAWLTARSIARDLPPPVPDRGGFRVDTGSAAEIRRWVFPAVCDGLRTLGAELSQPRQFIKVCARDAELRDALNAHWRLLPPSYFMIAGPHPPPARSLPPEYRLECRSSGSTIMARVETLGGGLAASGHAAVAAGVFVYDRIETAPDHRRRGLGAVVMNALRARRRSDRGAELLVATEEGRGLYASLGWSVLSPYATAVIAG